MHFVRDFKTFTKLLANHRPSLVQHDGHTLARALKESIHVRGGRGSFGRVGNVRHMKIVAEGHKRYADSFKRSRTG